MPLSAIRSHWSLPCIWLVCSLVSFPVEASDPDAKPAFQLDPAMDSVFIVGALLAAASSEALITTGEITIQFPTHRRQLLGIDAWVAQRERGSLRGAETSDVAVLVAMGWSIADIGLAALNPRPDSALTYAVLYLQSGITTWMLSNLFKLAVRRPRPQAYIELRESGTIDERTQQYLSFYSLHTAVAASLAATATYLAFTRNGPEWEKWLVLGGAIVVTSVVGLGRLLAAAHFTTDVLAGLGAGAVVGTLIPHLHRASPVTLAASADKTGGTLTLVGRF